MDTNRRLGWIAIGIGVLALFVALGGRGREAQFGGYGPYGYNQPSYGQTQPAPRGEWVPNTQQDQFGQNYNGYGPRGGFGPGRGGFGPFGSRWGHGGPGFFPFFILGGLFRLAVFGLIVFAVVKFLQRRRRNNGQGPTGSRNPESYTGETTNL